MPPSYIKYIKYSVHLHSSIIAGEKKIRQPQPRENEFRKQLTSWESRAVKKKQKWSHRGSHVTSGWFSGLCKWNTISQLTFCHYGPLKAVQSVWEWWWISSQPFPHGLKCKSFPKVSNDYELVVFPGEPCSGRCRRLTFLPLRLILKLCAKKGGRKL